MELDPNEFVASFLDKTEQEEVRKFVDNDRMREAVRKVILSGLYSQGVLKKGKKAIVNRNFAVAIVNDQVQTDEQIGQKLRAVWSGISALEQAFKDMELLRTVETTPEKKNEAR